MKNNFFIWMLLLAFPLTLSCAKQVEGVEAKNNSTFIKSAEESLMISKEEALEIAKKDAQIAYRDLTIYEVNAEVKENNWYIDYELKNPDLHGGGPHYVISGSTGEIISKRYEQ
ncbi:MAG TPA: hypothetical protein DDZ80_26810 [Cyanobacteria bacterium UBA8803]|nr:hypothetical protein [Cyanobacteria bacterium UBA8803]